ncbi:hypothetical protein GOBAR_DD25397 [Gossypium barbadense]|nr:hypothetical protein GOBAR_DD25397 [Gossypium barbadense]
MTFSGWDLYLEEFSSKVKFKSLELSSHEYKQPNPSREEPSELDFTILKRHEKSIEWTISNTEKGSVKGQNNSIQSRVFDLGKLESQWFKARIMDPIYKIQWVGLVPEKEGITKNGMILLRIITGRQFV